jgi:excisionase family DNA binding protein
LEAVLDSTFVGSIDQRHPQLVSLEEACRMLGLGRSKVYELVLGGELPSVRIGRARRIDVDDIRAFIAQAKDMPNS